MVRLSSTITKCVTLPVCPFLHRFFFSLDIFPIIDRKILDMLPGRPPQVTFSCDKSDASCAFQFWVAQVESFYCGLDNCTSVATPGYDYNTTEYKCEKIECKCVPGRFICGEDGSVGELLDLIPSQRTDANAQQTLVTSYRKRSEVLLRSIANQDKDVDSRRLP